MGTGYTRNDTANNIAADKIASASDLDGEFDAIVDAFAEGTGHSHDGSSAEGGYVPLIADGDANNKVEIDQANNRISLYTEVSSSPVEQVRVEDGVIYPVTNDDVDLGSSSNKFKDIYSSGTSNVQDLTIEGTLTYSGLLVFDTVASLVASTDLTNNSIYIVLDGFNGEPESFSYSSGSVTTPDNVFIYAATGMGSGNLISTRTVYSNYSELNSDPRTFSSGVLLTVKGIADYITVSSSADITMDGGILVDLLEKKINVKMFGGIGDGVSDDTDAVNSCIAFCKANNYGLEDTHNNVYRITSPNGVWFGSANVANTVRGATLNILVDVDDGVAFDLVGVQNGERDAFDLRYEIESGRTAQHGVVQSRPLRAATSSVYSSGNTSKLKINGRGNVYGAGYANCSSESNDVDGLAIFNPLGLTAFVGKDDWFEGKVVMTMNDEVSAYVIGETVTGGNSGATGKVLRADGSRMFIGEITGTFVDGETVTGASGSRSISSHHLFTSLSPNVTIETDDGATSTFLNFYNPALYNQSSDNLWPVIIQRNFNDVTWVFPNLNHSAGSSGDLVELHGSLSANISFGFLHASHRYSIVCGDVNETSSQVFNRCEFKGLNAGTNNTARLKVVNDNVRFEAPIIDLDGDLDFGAGDVFGNSHIVLGANSLISSGRMEGTIYVDSGESGNRLQDYTSASDDKRARFVDSETGLEMGRREVSATISSGSITLSGEVTRIFAESGSSDTLTDIVFPPSLVSGFSKIGLQLGSGSQDITLSAGTGNIRTNDNKNHLLKPDIVYWFTYDPRQDEFSWDGVTNADSTQLGFTAMTGTVRKGTLNTSTATLSQLAERVFALESALLAVGIIST